MSQLIEIVLPVFALILLGYGLAWSGYLPDGTSRALGDFVFKVPIPALVFYTLATAKLDNIIPWGLWFGYFGGVAFVWALAHLAVVFVFRRDQRVGPIAGVSAGFSNLVLLATPIVEAAFGPEGLVPHFMLLSVHLPVMMIASTVFFALLGEEEGPRSIRDYATEIFKNLLTNPIIIGILAGGAWRFFELPIEGFFAEVLGKITPTAIPLALLAMGLSLRRYGIIGNIGPAMVFTFLKLLVLPGVVFFLVGHVFELPRLWVSVLVIAAASPTGVNAYLIANHFGTGQGMATNTITLTTGLSVLTISFWLFVLGVG